ncbi:MAG: succinyl-diaminopimelate desuccinylase [Gammaproteobacteria bacterium]|nr:succinyl-diaminopimelate desuccinylase [Gammaproteobacteria bacterium]
MSRTLELAQELIRRRSVTPDDAGCQDVLAARLESLGFRCEWLDRNGVRNLWAVRGDDGPLFAFAGHTDVVPTGPETEWTHPPFDAVVADGILHGRGAADMKGSLAAMLAATGQFLADTPEPAFRIAFLITSDEEGPARDGTLAVMETLAARNEQIDYCIVGEPSSRDALGDVIRVGRRGSLNAKLRIKGKQGHVAYPDLAMNPIHQAIKGLEGLVERIWDHGQDSFPPTSFQISNISAGTGAENVIPGSLDCAFNFRYSPALTSQRLRHQVVEELRYHDIEFDIEWRESGEPFYTEPGLLRDAVDAAIQQVCGRTPEHSTGGGTSDGRYIAPSGAQVVELGPINATIHQLDEQVSVAELDQLAETYTAVLVEVASRLG